MAAKIDVKRFRGDTDPLVFTFSKNKVPLDITGNSYTLSVATTPDPLTASYVMQLAGVVTDPLAGVVTFTPTELEADFIGDYYYDIQMANGLVKKTVVTGKFKMTQDITK